MHGVPQGVCIRAGAARARVLPRQQDAEQDHVAAAGALDLNFLERSPCPLMHPQGPLESRLLAQSSLPPARGAAGPSPAVLAPVSRSPGVLRRRASFPSAAR